MARRDDPTQRAADVADAIPAGYRLRFVGPAGVVVVDVPRSGELVVGRGDDADVRLDAPSISRRHARFIVGEALLVEDLQSANGTRVRDRAVAPGERCDVAPGDAVTLGDVLCTVQGPAPGSRARLLRPHAYFEARVEDECARASGSSQPFAVIQVSVGAAAGADFERELLSLVRPIDVVALYGPGTYEVLAPGADAAQAEGLARLLRVRLGRSVTRFESRVAAWPRDGRTPQRLLAAVRASTGPVADDGVVVADPKMERLHGMIARVAAGAVNVLLLGETGTGKEVFASLVHRRSARASKPYVKLNCAAFTETLAESELFGHEKGAFTGANAAKAGLLESAEGGTVFLDEVGELSPTMQAKLLRVLEDREVRRVGALKARAVDVRVVAATNRDPEAEVAAGRFRADLYYRLNGFTLTIPPLRERVAEIAPLAQRFADRARQQAGRPGPAEVTAEAVEVLEGYRWPGNVRELRNVMERAVLLAGDEAITSEHLPVERFFASPKASPSAPPPSPSGAPVAGGGSDEDERRRIIAALEECAGNQTRAAERLGITRRQLVWRLERFGLPRPRR
jgi:two-component system response regulator AtoC